jgi:hypothetical protein
MENRQSQFIEKITKIFTNTGFGVEKFDEGTFDVIDRSIIGKVKIGSIKTLDNGDISIKLGGDTKKRGKFHQLMKTTSFKAKPTYNVATVAKIVKGMLDDYKKAKKEIYKESYQQYTVPTEITRDSLENAIDSYLTKVALLKENHSDVEENYADLLTFVADKLSLTEDACEAKFGDVLDLTLNYDESRFNKAMDILFEETELKSDFRKFLQENKEVDLMVEIKNDRALKALRNTDYYKNLDEDDKYRKLWKYIVGTHGSKFSMSEDLEDICRTLAHEDDENF